MFFKKLDLTHARNVYVVGDIHGMFTLLETELEKHDFDPEVDHLLSVGDLIDRGPESHLAIEYAQKPWFHFVRGNHEQLASIHLDGETATHLKHGGAWFANLARADQEEHARILNDAPVVMEVMVPSGRRIGIVHADFPGDDWEELYNVDPSIINHWTKHCLWNRSGIQDTPLEGIRNIDAVYYGHTPIRAPFRRGNCSWIDTGAYKSGILTVLKIR